jgi:phi13 family phage major tail protein
MATIGLRDVYYAKLKTDPVGGTATYDTPVRIVGAISANVNPNSSAASLFADDGPQDTAATLGEISLELNMSDLPLATQAELLGHTVEGGVLKKKGGDVPPWVAIGFRTLKSNGSYRYYWLNKGKFATPEEDLKTKGDSIEFQTPTITGSFVKRDSDDEWQRQADSDDTESATAITNWFKDPLQTEA